MIKPIPVPLGIVLTLVSLFVFGFCVSRAVKGWRAGSALVRKGVTTSGRVVRNESDTFPGSYGRSWFPVVAFEDGGRRHEFRSGTGASGEPLHREGDVLEVLYDPADPGSAEIKEHAERYKVAVRLVVLLGSLFGLAALFIGWLTVIQL